MNALISLGSTKITFRHRGTLNSCPLSGVKRTSSGLGEMSVFDLKRTFGQVLSDQPRPMGTEHVLRGAGDR